MDWFRFNVIREIIVTGARVCVYVCMYVSRAVALIVHKKNSLNRPTQHAFTPLPLTEEAYCNDLLLLIEGFKQPLERRQLLTPAEIATLFSNVETLLPVNRQILAELCVRWFLVFG